MKETENDLDMSIVLHIKGKRPHAHNVAVHEFNTREQADVKEYRRYLNES